MPFRKRVGTALGSIRTRLAFFFFLITLLAIGVVYIDVAPSLQSSLENQSLRDLTLVTHDVATRKAIGEIAALAKASEPSAGLSPLGGTGITGATGSGKRSTQPLAGAQATNQLNAYNALEKKLAYLQKATGADYAVVLQFQKIATGRPQAPISDAYPPDVSEYVAGQLDDVALHTVDELHPKLNSRIVSPSLGVVAVPVGQFVVVFTVNFSDVQGDVVLIRQRILFAAGIALLVVLLLGVLVARAITVRVLRLEHSAQRVAAGDFTAHFEVDSTDELGQLAGALAHMQSQLQELERARRRFIAIASHELRTPIFSLGGFLELIQDEDLDEETRRQFVGQVREQVARLGKLATGLLDLSRLEAGSVELHPTPTDLGVLARAVASEFGPALSAHSSDLALKLPDEPLRAICDPDRVAQLLRILIDNAITHTPKGTAVTVGVEPADEDASAVRLSVIDNGPGIPPDAGERIFEPFYSADGVQGAGLGLAIARELAERLRGSLDASAEHGTTVFALTLPVE